MRTRLWRWGFSAPGNYGTIPTPLWMIIERKRAISGSKTAEFQSLPPGGFPCYLDPKLLISLFFCRQGVLVAGEFTVYKKRRYDRISAHPVKNLILFSHLEGRGAYANLPR